MANDYPFSVTYNTSSFDGRVESDFLKFGKIPDRRKKELIDFTSSDFVTHRNNLLNYMKAVFPFDYSNFVESDYGVQLVEVAAYLGAINSNKIDLLANNLYLDTALTKPSTNRLLQLIGIHMHGPTSAKASGKLELDSPISSSQSVVISNADRTINIPGRDSATVDFTLYKVKQDGGIRLQDSDIELQYSEGTNGDTFTNLVLLEGRLRSTAGNFSTTQSIQTVEITDTSIIEGSISVLSADGVFEEVKNIYLASGTENLVFQKIYKEDNSVTLVFGDGINAKAPTPGSEYTVRYRTGGGSRGNVIRGAVTSNITATITGGAGGTVNGTLVNSTAAAGGFESESVEHAKRYSPGVFAAQYRAVTAEDYAALSNAFVGTGGKTGKAIPVLRSNGAAANMIDIYVLEKATDLQLQRASFVFKNELYAYLNDFRMLTDEITILDGVVRTVDLVCTVFIDKNRERLEEEIKRKAATAIQTYFNIDNRDFGEKFSIGELLSEVIKVPEVRFFSVNNIDKDVYVNFNELIQLNNLEINIEIV